MSATDHSSAYAWLGQQARLENRRCFHDFRDTVGDTQAESFEDVSEFLGRSDIKVTWDG